MDSIDWCLKQKKGIKKIEPSKNTSHSYLYMAEESILALSNLEKSKIWAATSAYYIFYYSLYSLMLRIGVKSEIHACSIEFMKRYLTEFYNLKDMEMISKACNTRINLQYYSDRPVNEEDLNEIKAYCKDFYIKTKENVIKITEEQINIIRERIKAKAVH